MAKEKITKSSGNVFTDLGFPPEETTVLAMHADLMARLRLLFDQKGWTQGKAATELGVAQSRISDLARGKWDKFNLDMLLMLASRSGLHHGLEQDPRL